MQTSEPTPDSMRNPWRRHWMAVRPAFLTVSVVGWLIGLANAHHDGYDIAAFSGAFSLLAALFIHAAVNVLNDYYDHHNGTDAINLERIYPFTGGSRFIQNGVLTPVQTLRYGLLLMSGGIAVGLVLAASTDLRLVGLGAVGVLIGWAYSAPPLALNSRGFGEFCVAIGFGMLIPLGTDWVQRGDIDWELTLIALPFALLVTNILYINQFPDLSADDRAGKHHLVVRLGAQRGRWLYLALVIAAAVTLVAAVRVNALPLAALAALLPLTLALRAASGLVKHAEQPARLTGSIKATITAALAHGSILAVVLLI